MVPKNNKTELIQAELILGLMCVLTTKKNTNCWIMMCSRKCSIALDIMDFLEILKLIAMLEVKTRRKIFWKSESIQTLMIVILEMIYKKSDITVDIIKSLVPLICSTFSKMLNMKKENINNEFLTKMFDAIIIPEYLIYFVMEIHYMSITQHKSFGANNFIDFMTIYIKQKYDNDFDIDIEKMIRVFKHLDLNNDVKRHLPVLYPLDLNYKIIKINSTKRFSSNTAPLLIDIQITNDIEEKNVKIILKKDDKLRKEKIVSCLMSLLQFKLIERVKNNKLPSFENIPTYEIMMLTLDFGIIEFVEDSVTLRTITDEFKSCIQSYVSQENEAEVIEITMKRFIQSLAISSCMSYILGLGDRHLDNIMINKKGQIFHIDYGYIMENPITNILGTPNIKMTKDMMNCLDAYNPNSKNFKQFKTYVTQVYDIMRFHKNIIVNYYEILGDEKFMNWVTFRNKLEGRFMDGMKCDDIEIKLMDEIKTSSNSIANVINDFCHNTKQKWTGFNFGLFY
jgi:hypothetical protein